MNPVHHRSIDIAVSGDSSETIAVTGRLIDTRGTDLTTFSGRQVNAGDELHGMEVELTIGRDLIIRKAVARMPFVPESGCDQVAPSVGALVGLKLGRGFSRAARERIGDATGCQHLTALVTAMAPAAMQGYWAHFGSPIRTGHIEPLIDSCRVFRSDSGLVRRLKAKLQRHKHSRSQESAKTQHMPLPNRS